MTGHPGKSRAGLRPWLFALLAAGAVLATGQLIEHLVRGRVYEQERLAVLTRLTSLRAHLESLAQGNLLAVHGLAAVIAAHPDIDQREFSRICSGLVGPGRTLRNIAGAPGLVVSLMYPLPGNEAALGLDYRTHPLQREDALRAMRTGQPILAGPLPLRQGGIGIIIREPVFVLAGGSADAPRFWGIISAVFDSDVLYRESGLVAAATDLRLALRRLGPPAASEAPFFGEPDVLRRRPVTIAVSLPGVAWELAAVPRAGWYQATAALWPIRLTGFTIALAAALMTFLLVRSNLARGQSEGRLRTLLDTIPDLVWLKALDGTFLVCNPRFEQLVGRTEAEVVGRREQDLFPPAVAGPRRASERSVIAAGGKAVLSEEWFTFASDGRRRLFEIIETPVCDARGRPLGVLGIAREITERKRYEDEIRQLNAELEGRVESRTAELAAINKELETFTYSVSHDLKAPLRGIDGYSRLLLEDHAAQLDEEGRLFLGNVRRGVEQMGQLIEDLLAYSRMERRGLRGVPLDLALQVAGVLAEREQDLAARGATVETALAGLVVVADRDGLAVILRNLLDNALKFAAPGRAPRIQIAGRADEKSIILSVEDNGVGFDMQFHDRIFEIFQRLQRAEDYPGTGVGLAIVRKAAQRMGGRVWAEGRPGVGATFHVELPR